MFVDKPLPNERPTGIGVAAYNTALALSKRGISVYFVCRGAIDQSAVVNEGLTIRTIRNYSKDNGRVALELLRKEHPDVVHVHSSAALPSILLGRALGRAVVMHSHGDEPLRPIRLTIMRRIGMGLSQRVIAVSNSNREELIRNQQQPPGKVDVAYNGVDIEDFKPVSDTSHVLLKYNLDGADKILLSVGAVQQRKGQWTMIRCLPKILERWPGLTYVNVGSAYDSSYQNRLLRGAEGLGVSKKVKFLSAVPHDDLVALISSANVCVHPSIREGFGLAVVEEMACGRAVVALDIGAMPEIIDDQVNGLLVQPDDQDKLTTSLVDLLGDVQFCRKLGDAARAKVSAKFTWDQTASRLETLYNELVY